MTQWGTLVDSLQGKRQQQTYLARLARQEVNRRRTAATHDRVLKAALALGSGTVQRIAADAGLSTDYTRKVLYRLEVLGLLETVMKKDRKNGWTQHWMEPVEPRTTG